MVTLSITLSKVDKDYLSQLEYAMAFVAEQIESYAYHPQSNQLVVTLPADADAAEIRIKVEKLVRRFEANEFGFKSVVHYEYHRSLPKLDVWSELIDRKLVAEVGDGHVVLRGAAAALQDMIGAKVRRTFVKEFGAELEIYPATIQCRTLDRCNHFTSFPEHIDFVSHLIHDVDLLKEFSDACNEGDWTPGLHEKHMAEIHYAICPSACYHCYEAMEGHVLDEPGRCITTVVSCHRFEGANQTTMSRLRAFTMCELVWVGKPKYVLAGRARADELIEQWAREWELDCSFETANDMFFTDDFAVKASFQRQQEAKRELRLTIPQEDRAISVFSSNFHAMTFGKAFDIKCDKRPAASACIGWGYERWVYALFSQFGFELRQWPEALQVEFRAHLKELEVSHDLD